MSEAKKDIVMNSPAAEKKSEVVQLKGKFTPKKSKEDLQREEKEEDYCTKIVGDWLPEPHPKMKDEDDDKETYDNEVLTDWLGEDRKRFEGQLKRKTPVKTMNDEDLDSCARDKIEEWLPPTHPVLMKLKDDKENYEGEIIGEWFSEDRKKFEGQLKTKRSSHNMMSDEDKEDYKNENIVEWLPKPHPKMKDDDDKEVYETEVTEVW